MRHGSSAPVRALLAIGLAAGLATLGTLGTAYAGTRQAGAVQVTGTIDNKFDPADIKATADASGKVTIQFTAHGTHTMQSDDAKFDSGQVNDGQTTTISFTAKPGTYSVYCLYHKASGMTATLTVAGGGGKPAASSAAATPTSTPTPTPSATVGEPQPGVGAPTPTASTTAEEVPGLAGNKELEAIDASRAAEHGAVSGFRFFTMVAVAFLVILCAAVLFSTRPRRANGR